MAIPIPYSAAAEAPAAASPPPKPRQRLPHRWSHGRGYGVIVLLAPLVLGSFLLVHLHAVFQRWLQMASFTFQASFEETHD
ncbi:hypothetical protein [Pseudanabaena sp. FACHB-2040]|uniref:hypothetical protein n=1 Tax=Pseudanabaena sp. FACHB-2040 TaxID=2692859 RepID=UPI001684460E|nr:hypothetical protein [Pseudanabaena sp. FACHB-2040]MBD2259484.1 hypothetical protein [Pseudanabaena sp. FACHB-2040]